MSEGAREFCLPPELVAAARRAIDANRAAGRRIAVAESCTGGLVAAALTEAAGSSDVFDVGFVTYSNGAKTALLGVGEALLSIHGAVSAPVARAMAQGALERTAADVAVSITGIAGPGGGSEEKPVGTVLFARAVRGEAPDRMIAEHRRFGDMGRGGVRLQAALCALELLLP